MDERDPSPAGSDASTVLNAWAADHGTVYQSTESMVVVHGDMTQHFYPEHPDGDEDGWTTTLAAGRDVYPGLRAFGTSDAPWFHGREKLISELLSRLDQSLTTEKTAESTDAGAHSPVAVVAPSGAGKSSLLRAGLLPELGKGQLPGSQHWPQLLLTPTATPLAALATGLALLTKTAESEVEEALRSGPDSVIRLVRERLALPPGGRVLLVVDQLEELFTLCQDESARHRFVAVLAALTGDGTGSPVALTVYGLRADVYGSCAAHPHFRDALVNRQVIVGPMTDQDVRKAVTLPARQGGLTLEPGLVDDILRDLRGSARHADGDGGDGTYEAGRLPLLAHALRATWLRRDGNALTRGGYRRTGGIDGAVRATAEAEFGRLGGDDRRTARQLFLSLARIDKNGDVARRRRTRAELLRTTTASGSVPDLVEQFTQARLLTQGVERGQATVEITHEALLTAWPQLRSWIRPEVPGQADVLLRQELEEAAMAWLGGDRKDTASLYRGARLELARSWAAYDGNEDLTEVIRDFLAASRRYERRTRLAWRGGVAVMVVLGLLASALAVFAFYSRADALKQRDNAVFDRVTAEADRQRNTNGPLAAQLDLVAYRMRPTAALRTRLMQGAGAVTSTALPGEFGVVHSVSFGPGGRLATGGDALRLWDTSDPAGPAMLGSLVKGHAGTRVVSAYNPKGDLLAISTGDGWLRTFDVSDARRPVALSGWIRMSRGQVPVLRFSPDGRTLALGANIEADGTMTGVVELWSVADPRNPRRLSTVLTVRRQGVMAVAFSPDGHTLVVGGGTGPGNQRDRLLRLWNISDPARPTPLGGDLGVHTAIVNQVAYSPVKPVMASASSDGRVLVWDLSQPRSPKYVRQLFLSSAASAVAFSPDGRLLATGEVSGKVSLFNVMVPDSTRSLGLALQRHTSSVTSLSFDAGGRTLASGSGDGKVLLWRLPATLAVVDGSGSQLHALALSGDGRLLAVASTSGVTLWDTSDPARLSPLGRLPRLRSQVNALAFPPNGSNLSGRSGQTVLATGSGDGGVRLWDVSAPARPVELGTALPSLTEPAGGMVFDSSGHTLIAGALQFEGGFTGGLGAWDVSDPARPVSLGDSTLRELRQPLRALAAASRGGYVYTGDLYDGILRVWRTNDGAVPTVAGEVGSGQIVYDLAADPRTGLIATGNGDSTVRLWDVSRPSSLTAVGHPLYTSGSVQSVGFSSDGRLLASGDSTGQVRLWNTSDPARPTAYGLPVAGHGGAVWAMRFSPRAGLLITGATDGTVRLWQTDPARARTLLCASTANAMTASRWKEYVSPDLPYDPPCGT